MFTTIKTYDGKHRQAFEDWVDEIDHACRLSGYDFRTAIIKKSTGAVCQVVMACDGCSDDELLAKLRISFSDAPTMNQAWKELRKLSAILIEQANIQSRSLEMMVASKRNQQEAFHKLTKASKDKENNAMFTTIKTYDGKKQTGL